MSRHVGCKKCAAISEELVASVIKINEAPKFPSNNWYNRVKSLRLFHDFVKSWIPWFTGITTVQEERNQRSIKQYDRVEDSWFYWYVSTFRSKRRAPVSLAWLSAFRSSTILLASTGAQWRFACLWIQLVSGSINDRYWPFYQQILYSSAVPSGTRLLHVIVRLPYVGASSEEWKLCFTDPRINPTDQIQSDKKSVHMMIAAQKTCKNILNSFNFNVVHPVVLL
jgi:hypothetical protein